MNPDTDPALPTRRRQLSAALVFMALMCLVLHPRTCTAASSTDDLQKTFQTPPDSVRPSCYWWWFNNLMDKEGIVRDLHEFKAKGMGGVTIVSSTNGGFGGNSIPEGPVFLSPEWRELYKFALHEADALGLVVGINLCSGWCMGGPWITPENGGRWFLQSETTVTGPSTFSAILPLPNPKSGYDSPPQLNVGKFIGLPLNQVDYRDTAIIAFRDNPASQLGSGRSKDLAAKSNRLDGSVFLSAREAMDQTLSTWANLPADQPISPTDVIDLTTRVHADGHLDWEVPAGTWTIIRTGHRLTGQRVSLPSQGTDGLEVDWFSTQAVDQHWEHLGKILAAEAGPLAGKTLKFFFTESFEDGYPNWTSLMVDQFKLYRGYDPTPYFPVFSGRMVGSADISARFLHDYRKTMADCFANNNYGHLAKLAHGVGMDIQCEAAGPSWSGTVCMDGLKNLGRCGLPMGEVWQDLFLDNGQNKVGKQTSCAAHIYGCTLASAEACTSFTQPWGDAPGQMKPTIDRAFCEGINRCVFHTMTGSRPQDGVPGYEYGAGTHFNPNITWWQQAAGPWLMYVDRCQALLQSGHFVADVLFYNGDWAPNLVEPKHVDPGLGSGYDYDVCNAEVLLTRLSAKDGRLTLPDGMNYSVLVLPARDRMPAEVVRKIKDLVAAGATVIGPRPKSDPGLKDYPHCDVEVTKTAAEVWGDCDGQAVKQHQFGKGRIVWGQNPREILIADGVLPDFESTGGQNAFIDFIHRHSGQSDVYFLVNRNGREEHMSCTFRIGDRKPEFWDPVSGTIRDATEYTLANGRITVPIEFPPLGSLFVVFRTPGAPPPAATVGNFATFQVKQELSGPWSVHFDPAWLYPQTGLTKDQQTGTFTFDKLEDWSKRPEDAIRHYSGTASYHLTFDLPVIDHAQQLSLDIGVLERGTARIRLNGKDLGVVWCAPWRLDITEAVKPHGNQLEIEVVNLWPNRLIGDAGLDAKEQKTRTNIRGYKKEDTLLPSGLIGPVTILISHPTAPAAKTH